MRALLTCFVWFLAASPWASRPLLMAHYLPWFEAKPKLGWHWTMDRFDPKQGELASNFRPLVGPYDSGDAHVIEFHLLTMKRAGIDGVIIDWYGIVDHFDYAMIHRNSTKLIDAAERMGLKVAICYEDQTIPKLAEANKLGHHSRAGYAKSVIKWLGSSWFKRPHYLRFKGKPVFLSFGYSGLDDAEWKEALRGESIHYFSEHRRRDVAVGAYDWPAPRDYPSSLDRFYSSDLGVKIPVVFPRFSDIYEKSYGNIPDANGETLKTTLQRALSSKAPIVQIATWNDWGEGTQIEPSVQMGYRDLRIIQSARGAKGDLQLPYKLFLLRQEKPDPKLNGIAELIRKGEDVKALTALTKFERL